MKICIAIYDCMDLGGIINHTEHLAAGLIELGHEVSFFQICYKEGEPRAQKGGADLVKVLRSGTGVPYRQGLGWTFPAHNRLNYHQGSTTKARRVLCEHDIVIWTIPVPPKNKPNKGNDVWPELYDLPGARQIAISHDGNAARGYPHILHIAPHLSGLACVHPCALNTCEFVKTPRAMIVNPQVDPVGRSSLAWADRSKGFVNAQTFKAWKHAHELIGAIRFMKEAEIEERRLVVGKGIEYQYLTSEDKCKDAYFHKDGHRFWDKAEDNGMNHRDYMDEFALFAVMAATRAVVDPSWSERYSKKGGHFNRVLVEGMMAGCVPVGRLKGVGDDFFVPGLDYVAIPEDADLQQYAEFLDGAAHAPENYRDALRESYLPKLAQFDRKVVAKKFVDLAMGELPSEGTHVTDIKTEEKCDDILFEHFGIL